jgi:hypothetical protein
MPGSSQECRQRAEECYALAADSDDPVWRESFMELAARWSRIAIDLEYECALLDQWAPAKP